MDVQSTEFGIVYVQIALCCALLDTDPKQWLIQSFDWDSFQDVFNIAQGWFQTLSKDWMC